MFQKHLHLPILKRNLIKTNPKQKQKDPPQTENQPKKNPNKQPCHSYVLCLFLCSYKINSIKIYSYTNLASDKSEPAARGGLG